MSIQLAISSVDYGPARVFKLSGYLAQLEIYRFKRAIEHALLDGKRAIVANLEDIEFIDSAGISSLIHMRKEGNRAGARAVVVLRPNSGIRKVIAATNLGDFIQVYSSELEALKSCGVTTSKPNDPADMVTDTNVLVDKNSCETIIDH